MIHITYITITVLVWFLSYCTGYHRGFMRGKKSFFDLGYTSGMVVGQQRGLDISLKALAKTDMVSEAYEITRKEFDMANEYCKRNK